MYTTQSKNTPVNNLKLFGNVRVLIIAGLLIAMSSVFGKLLAFDLTPFIRISIENLPIIMAGIFFGPFVGGAVGLGADLLGCALKGYSVAPLITLGFVCIGVISGLISMKFKPNKAFNLALAVFIPHIICSMLIKSYGLHTLYGTPMEALLWRIPTYLVIASFEFAVILLLTRNKAFSRELDKICSR